MPSLETKSITELDQICDEALNQKRYLFLADMTGTAAEHFQKNPEKYELFNISNAH